MVDIQTGPIIHDLFVYVFLGMNVSTKRKDNKMVMEHKKRDNQKWIITRSPVKWQNTTCYTGGDGVD